MEKQQPTSPRCLECGEQPKLTTSMMDPSKGRVLHVFDCNCGNKTWTSEKA
jgi:hypothetical protein